MPRKKPEPPIRLTACEQDVLRHVNRGATNTEIAKARKIGVPTTSLYLHQLYSKIGGKTRYELVERARALGLVKTPADGGLKRLPLRLRKREREILTLLREHLTPSQIGKRMRLTPGTVSSTLSILHRSYGVSDNLALIDTLVEPTFSLRDPRKHSEYAFNERLHILDLKAQGHSNAEVGRELGVTRGNLDPPFHDACQTRSGHDRRPP